MDLGLSGVRVVVTGAGAGIGLAITRRFVEEGAHVVAGSRTITPELTDLMDSGRVRAIAVDLSEPEGPARLIESAGPVDVLVNNVGVAPTRLEGFLSVTDEMWSRTLELDLMAAVRAIRAALPGMVAAHKGVVVTIGSLNARLPDPLVVDYSAAKAALVNLSKSLSKEFGPRGVRFNVVDPGPVATDLWLGTDGVAAHAASATGRTPQQVVDAAAQGMLTGRFSTPEEVADLVLILASDRTANVTGTDVVIDGGMVTTL